MKILYLIPARGGSKGIPHKNIKPLNGKPLILYSVEVARELADDADICVTTDDDDIIKVVESVGLKVPFKRPDELATDTSGSYEVILHAIDFYKQQGINYDAVVLLQPTSPFRTAQHVREAIELYESSLDMVVSVSESPANPYYTLFEENENGFLRRSKESNYVCRQDCPTVYEYNGAIYVMNVNSLHGKPLSSFTKIKKYVMDRSLGIDLDTPLDWKFAEFLINNQ
ncbi:cytidylyltransferase domain-containing protein [Parabacteroides sp. FAFU027]|uniref:acylneuraminate cytidylyltransferase family protein n=1 Tax=Parabacteroides sp. FAFU027 TaxID=2922715 RepID=UPI001FAFBFF1|nr:acylneuraminate cytidylyltransferase family protein [Parabacteroides sp. FAFU027]